MSINSVFEMDAVNIIIYKIIMNIFHLFFYFQNFKNNQVANQISTIKKDVAEIKPATSNLYICYFVPVKATPFTYNV